MCESISKEEEGCHEDSETSLQGGGVARGISAVFAKKEAAYTTERSKEDCQLRFQKKYVTK